MPGCNKRLHVLKQTCSSGIKELSMYDLLVDTRRSKVQKIKNQAQTIESI